MALAFSEFFIIFASVTICSVIFKDGCELLSNLVLRFIIDYLFVSVLKITPNGCEPLGSFFFRLFLTNRVKKSKNTCINQFFCLPLPSEIEKDMIRITEAITYAKEKGLLGKKQKAELRKLTEDLKRELRASRDELDAMVALDKGEQRLESSASPTLRTIPRSNRPSLTRHGKS